MVDHKLDEEIKISIVESRSSSEEDLSAAVPDLQIRTSAETELYGDFNLGAPLGDGVLGKVFEAKNDAFDEKLALKKLNDWICPELADKEALISAIKNAADIHHPNLASIYDCGATIDGAVYFVTDRLKGQTLKERFASSPLMDKERFIDLFRQICHALKGLHQRRILHGDLKPSNVFLLDSGSSSAHEQVKLVDYAIVGALPNAQRDQFLSQSSKPGAGNYLSPEHCLGYALDARSDIYSIGLLMYEALSGHSLVNAHSQVHSMMKQLNVKPRSLRSFRDDIPESLEKIVLKCLEKNRGSRYFSIEDLELDLDIAAAEAPGLAGVDEQPLSSPKLEKDKHSKRQLVIVGISAMLCSSLVASMTMALVGRGHAPQRYGINWMHQNNYSGNTMYPGQHHYAPPMRNSEDCILLAKTAISQAITSRSVPIGPTNSVSDPAFSSIEMIPAKASVEAQQNYRNAVAYYKRALDLIKLETADRSSSNYVRDLAEIEGKIADVYSRAGLDGFGGYYPNDYLTISAQPGSSGNLKLIPSYRGLVDTPVLLPDYQQADDWYKSALARLADNLSDRDLDLLRNAAFTKVQLNKIDEAIAIHRRIADVLSNQKLKDVDAELMNYDTIGRLYMSRGEFGKAVHEFKIASKLDHKAYKING
ncbi:MAG: serine/threonine protein kinase, partial [Candidatus Obscuribacterales bacterium]|nr:serine/threonine protein kinase [Candidatus Obscuribacterales bacterium]